MKLNRGNFRSNLYFMDKYKLLSKKDRILEIGSGTGNMLNFLKNKGFKVYGSELNPDHIRFAKKQFNLTVKKVTSEKLPFKRSEFDKVISFDVFEHLPDLDLHLKEISRVLKKGGVYIFSTPNKILDVPFEIYAFKSFTKYKEHHCSLQTYWSLKKIIEKNGFAISFYQIPTKNKFFLDKAKRYFGKTIYPLILLLPIDSLPIWLKTNFYVVARKLDE